MALVFVHEVIGSIKILGVIIISLGEGILQIFGELAKATTIALVQEHGGFVEFVRSCLNGCLLGIGKTGISLTSVESFGYNIEDRLVMELTTIGERNVYEVSKPL